MKLKDILAEEWSQKYKSSINCSNPKGFSQKAHCAGKKKDEGIGDYLNALNKGMGGKSLPDNDIDSPKRKSSELAGINRNDLKDALYNILNKKDLNSYQISAIEKLYRKV